MFLILKYNVEKRLTITSFTLIFILFKKVYLVCFTKEVIHAKANFDLECESQLTQGFY